MSFSEAGSSAATTDGRYASDFSSTAAFLGDSAGFDSLRSFSGSVIWMPGSPGLLSGWLYAISSILFSGRYSSRIAEMVKSTATDAAIPYQSLLLAAETRFLSLLFKSARSLPAVSASILLKPSDASSAKGSF